MKIKEFQLKSDYFRIEIGLAEKLESKASELKSDYFRIEMSLCCLFGSNVLMLKSDYFRIEMSALFRLIGLLHQAKIRLF